MSNDSLESILDEVDAFFEVDEDELTEEEKQARNDRLDSLVVKEASKTDALVYIIKKYEDDIDNIKEYIAYLKKKQASRENSLTWCKGRVLESMQNHGYKKLSGYAHSLSVRKNKQVNVNIDPKELPEMFQRVKTTVEADKVALKNCIESGVSVDGVEVVEKHCLIVK